MRDAAQADAHDLRECASCRAEESSSCEGERNRVYYESSFGSKVIQIGDSNMTTFTIHTEDPLADALRTAAQEAGTSINAFIKETMRMALGLVKPRQEDAVVHALRRATFAC